MTRSDIALTVGGILASMGLAYLLFREEMSNRSSVSNTSDATSSDATSTEVATPTVYDTLSSSSPIASLPALASTGSSSSGYQSDNMLETIEQIASMFPITPKTTAVASPVSSSTANGVAPTQPLASVETVSVNNDHIQSTDPTVVS